MKNVWSPSMIQAEQDELNRRSFTDQELKDIALAGVKSVLKSLDRDTLTVDRIKLDAGHAEIFSKHHEMNRETRARFLVFSDQLQNVMYIQYDAIVNAKFQW